MKAEENYNDSAQSLDEFISGNAIRFVALTRNNQGQSLIFQGAAYDSAESLHNSAHP